MGLEHLQILVNLGAPGSSPLQILRDDCKAFRILDMSLYNLTLQGTTSELEEYCPFLFNSKTYNLNEILQVVNLWPEQNLLSFVIFNIKVK